MLRAANGLADAIRLAWPGLRATVRENLRITHGAADPALVKAIYRHFAATLVDLAWYDRLFERSRLNEHFEIAGPGWDHYAKHGRDGCVCVTGHFGNWELYGVVFHYLDIPLSAVMRPPDTPWFRKRIARLRDDFGIDAIPKKNALPLAMKAVRRGRAVAFLNDQAAGRHGIPLPFLGQPAWTFTAPAALAKKLNVPLYTGYTTRLGDGIRYRCWTDEPVSTEGDVESITLLLNERLEEYVRAAPEQWWWFHKRFKPPKSQRVGRKLSAAGIPVSENT